jgi:hypothetical protein
MKLTIDDLKAYAKLNPTERKSEHAKDIREELTMRMRWMPAKWRRLIYWRYIRDCSVVRTAMEIHVTERSVYKWTREIAAWLEDKDKYLDELV